MFYSYKNCRLSIDGSGVIAGSVDFSIDASLDPKYYAGEKFSNSYVANAGLQGSIRIAYFITGNDAIRNYIANELPARIDLGGLTVESGYLKSYSFSASSNNPILVNAEFVFFDDLQGSFSPVRELVTQTDVLNFGDASISNASFNTNYITNFNYSYSTEIIPSYRSTRETGVRIRPERVVFGKKQIVSEIQFDKLDNSIDVTGGYGLLEIDLLKNDGSIAEVFVVEGSITRKNLSVGVGKLLLSSVTVKQDKLNVPTITTVAPASGAIYEYIDIVGTNFDATSEIYFGKIKATDFFMFDSTEMIVSVPQKAVSAPIYIMCGGGTAATTGKFIVIDPGISF